MKLPNRTQDVRIQITKSVFTDLAPRFWVRKGSILDGSLDKSGNFCLNDLIVYPTHFKVLGKFYFRRSK